MFKRAVDLAAVAPVEEYDGVLIEERPQACGCVQETWRQHGGDKYMVRPCGDHVLTVGLGRYWP